MRVLVIIILGTFSIGAHANSDNDRREAYGDGGNKDGAAYVGDQKTKQLLTPPMTQHYALATTYFAVGNIPMGTMEQKKGDMLKQQIEENKKTADKNRQSEKLVNENADEPENRDGAQGTRVITVDQERKNPPNSAPPSPTTPSFETSSPALPPLPFMDRQSSPGAITDQLAPLRDRTSGTEVASDSARATTDATSTGTEAAAAVSDSSTVSSAQSNATAETTSTDTANDKVATVATGAVQERTSGSWQDITTILLEPGKSATKNSTGALDKDFFSTHPPKAKTSDRSRRDGGRRPASQAKSIYGE